MNFGGGLDYKHFSVFEIGNFETIFGNEPKIFLIAQNSAVWSYFDPRGFFAADLQQIDYPAKFKQLLTPKELNLPSDFQ